MSDMWLYLPAEAACFVFVRKDMMSPDNWFVTLLIHLIPIPSTNHGGASIVLVITSNIGEFLIVGPSW